MRRHFVLAVACLAPITVVSGCVFTYDETPPQVTYGNKLDVNVTVHLEGEDRPFERLVKRGTAGALSTDECLGTAIVVETEDGYSVGRVDEPACPDWELVINEDGTLHYAGPE